MKFKWKKWIAGLLAAISVVSLTGCFNTESISAYEIAVQNGFTGTEQEWLDSLKGANGKDGQNLDIDAVYDAAVKNGYTGSFLEFLKEYFSVDVQEGNDTKQIAENLTSVVSIFVGFKKTTTSEGIFGGFNSETTPFASAGSGVIVSLNKNAGNAYIVTNYHVVYDSESNTTTGISDSIWLYLYGSLNGFSVAEGKDVNGGGIKATFVGGSMDYDIAVLKVEGSSILQNSLATAAAFGDSNNVIPGEKVFVIGNPEGEGISVTSGVLSVDSEYIEMQSSDDLRTVEYRVMRTDAAINHGNSGGGMFNAKGELIGIVNAKSTAEDVDNMGYALPITQVKHVMQNAVDNGGAVHRAMLGITVATTGSSVRLDGDGNLVIEEELTIYEAPKLGAAAYGLLVKGDVLKEVTINGKTSKLTRRFHLIDLLLQVRLGDSVTLKIERGGEEKSVQIAFDKGSYFTLYK